MTRYLVITLAALSSVALGQAPSRFSASIDNFGAHTYIVELRDGKLVYSDTTPKSAAETVTIRPSVEQWRDFRRELDALGVWVWHDSYAPAQPIFDGTGWSLSLRYPDRSLVTGGSNAYPDRRAFRQFEAAVEALLGGRAFRIADDAPNQ